MGSAAAQPRFGGGSGRRNLPQSSGNLVRTEGGGLVDEDTVRTARETASHSNGTPNWTNPKGFEGDVFTFARILFPSNPNQDNGGGGSYGGWGGWGRGRRLGWWVDYPDADLNLSYRLQQMTSMLVDPDARVVRLSDPDLLDYPFIFMEHPGYMELRDDEMLALRKYLQIGGALFVTDFWGEREWHDFEDQMQRVLPGRKWVELSIDHPLFHCVFDLKGPIKAMQVPTIQFWNHSFDPKDPNSHLQWRDRGEGYETMHVRAWLDDKQRIMAVATLNSDVSDGWERETENEDYFKRFAEPIAYPLAINIIFYMMTH
jgi:hypothetical protein